MLGEAVLEEAADVENNQQGINQMGKANQMNGRVNSSSHVAGMRLGKVSLKSPEKFSIC